MELREDVCILLNEREPLKHKMAQELESRLAARLRSCSRLSSTDDFNSVIRKRHPRVLVLDYLIGDEGTALDLLAVFETEKISIPVIIWTDEPSVSVAVSAMKMGAHDFLELSENTSVHKVIESIESVLQQKSARRRQSRGGFDSLIMHSEQMLATARKISALALESKPFVLYGELGAGRNSLARYFHSLRRERSAFLPFDWDLFTGEIEDLLPDTLNPERPAALADKATVFIDHLEFDPSTIIAAAADRRFSSAEVLILGTSDSETAQSCIRLLNWPIVEVPPLRDRGADFLPLTQRFAAAVPDSCRPQKLAIKSELVSQFFEQEWPGNVAEFKASLIEAIMCLADSSDGIPKPAPTGRIDDALLTELLRAKSSWERYHQAEPVVPSFNRARSAMRYARGDIRVAAARLGTGIRQIEAALNLRREEQNHGA